MKSSIDLSCSRVFSDNLKENDITQNKTTSNKDKDIIEKTSKQKILEQNTVSVNISNKNLLNTKNLNKNKKIKYSMYGMIRKYGVRHECSFGVIEFLNINFPQNSSENEEKLQIKERTNVTNIQSHTIYSDNPVQIIAVSKKAGIAVTRNKIKRRLKHIFREIVRNESIHQEMHTAKKTHAHFSFIIRVYKDISKILFKELHEQIQEIYKTITK